MFVLRNYNRFLVGTTEHFGWDDFYIHRFAKDYKKLVKFNTIEEARDFREQHPEIEDEFAAWIVKEDGSRWV